MEFTPGITSEDKDAAENVAFVTLSHLRALAFIGWCEPATISLLFKYLILPKLEKFMTPHTTEEITDEFAALAIRS